MALLDTFLKLMDDRQAERLLLAAERVPCLVRGGVTTELSMPPLGRGMLDRVAREITGGDIPPDGAMGVFQSAGVDFTYRIEGDGTAIEVGTSGSGGAPVPTAGQAPAGQAPDSHRPARKGVPTQALLATLHQALAAGASDVFLSSGRPPRMRRDGIISTVAEADAPTCDEILGLLPDEAASIAFERDGSVDFGASWDFSDGPRRIRANLFRHLDGIAAALRPIRTSIPRLAELGLPEDLLELTELSGGLVLVTGTSGSGKSTTLAALIDHINRTSQRHIITIEDPVEYRHHDIRCLVHQREVGAGLPGFASGLRDALRENPDVILLGELRDLDTISAALTAAETGHLVFATLHSGGATAAVNRLVDVFPGHQQAHVRAQLALSLRAVLAQRLLPARAGGLVPAIEKLLVTPAVANAIREGRDHFMRDSMVTGVAEGMFTLDHSLAGLVRNRRITRETALRHARDPEAIPRPGA